MHVLKVGDAVHTGDVILTSQNGIVQMTDERGASQLATLLPPDDANRVIEQLNSDDPDAATAAGLAGGDGGLQPGLRVDRISEGVSGAGFQSESGLAGRAFDFIGTPVGITTSTLPPVTEPPETNPANQPPQATPGHYDGNEDTRIPIALTGSDSDGSVVGVTVTSIPAGSSLLLADGSVVTVGQTLTPAQAASLLIQPPHDFNGGLEIGFTVSDDQGAVSTAGAGADRRHPGQRRARGASRCGEHARRTRRSRSTCWPTTPTPTATPCTCRAPRSTRPRHGGRQSRRQRHLHAGAERQRAGRDRLRRRRPVGRDLVFDRHGDGRRSAAPVTIRR